MITAIPHWWISWSFITSVTVQDGGDQITAVLSLLLVPVSADGHAPVALEPLGGSIGR